MRGHHKDLMGVRIASICIRKDARALGETEQRLYVLGAWEEASVYSERERAALALTDAVTRITGGHVPDSVFECAQAHFNEQELIALGLP
jgi:alkylhydroperoxidase family enzyme